MSRNHNPQAEQMGDASMARNLAHQAAAIWPQEQHLFERYALEGPIRILDLGCGTGEISRRLAARYPQAEVLGIDILESNLRLAETAGLADGRIRYEVGDAFALQAASGRFDLVVCRHMSQAVPDFPGVLAEISRVLRPGGWLHLLSEDYAMLHFPTTAFDPDGFWHGVVLPFLRGLHCDPCIGRHSWALLQAAGYGELQVAYVCVDTLRAARADFAGILTAWRDGYSEVLAEASGRSLDIIGRHFDAMIAAINDPASYAVWQVPVISGRRAAG